MFYFGSKKGQMKQGTQNPILKKPRTSQNLKLIVLVWLVEAFNDVVRFLLY